MDDPSQPKIDTTAHDLEQLLLSKYLYERGVDTLRNPGPFGSGVAVSLFHDSIEIMLATVANKVDVTITKKSQVNFFEWWELIEKADQTSNNRRLPSKDRLRTLNDARISYKHLGRCPTEREARSHQIACETFQQQTLATYFPEVDFERLSLSSLISYHGLRQPIQSAEEMLRLRDLESALQRCADAQAAIDAIQEPFVRVPIQVSYPPGLPQQAKRYIDDQAAELRRSINFSNQLSLSGHFGVNPIHYAALRSILPMKQGHRYIFAAGALKTITFEEVEKIINMQIRYALALWDALAYLERSKYAQPSQSTAQITPKTD